jgi:MoxR-like ATPase
LDCVRNDTGIREEVCRLISVEQRAAEFCADFQRLEQEVHKAIVGLDDVVENTLVALIVGGHVLLEGVPGLGKTYLVRTLSEALRLKFSRIQFTPDLMPADIIGTNLVMERPDGGKFFEFQPGPVFANIILADEINRATPKTQSALLEAMQEHSVTSAGVIRHLDEPFFVLATQNPIEMEGTYPLPEAQIDRFFFKVNLGFPTLEELGAIMDRTTAIALPRVECVVEKERLLEMQSFLREVPVAPHVKDYAMRVVLATHPTSPYATERVKKYVRYGASPRGGQALMLAGKTRALLDGRYNVSFSDIEMSLFPGLRHRIILNFEGEAEGITPDSILADILEKIPHEP